MWRRSKRDKAVEKEDVNRPEKPLAERAARRRWRSTAACAIPARRPAQGW